VLRRLPLFGVAAFGCGDDSPGTVVRDAAPTDAWVFVDAIPVPDGDVLGWVDFAARGCTVVDTGDRRECHGVAPLAVGFAPIAPAAIDLYRWEFGDGAASTDATPEHTYALPGRYSVALAVAGAGGAAAISRRDFVVVAPAVLGGGCDDDRQCGDGRRCTPTGQCAAPCDDAACAEGVCAELPIGAWCLPACDAAPCPVDAACTTVPSDGGWVAACSTAGAFGAIGESCAGAEGLDDARCASGRCAPLGLRGACSAACDAAACPPGSACATFNGVAEAICLAECGSGVACDDPWLGCVAPGGAGDLGFTVDVDGGSYCAPRPCTGADDCPAGTCSGGYCRR
jgi:hypothetical protein